MYRIKPPNGRCFICHKSTKLLIHAPCIAKAALLQGDKRSRDKKKVALGEKYLAGHVPWFAKD